MTISDRSLDPLTGMWRYVVELSNNEIALSGESEARFSGFVRSVMKRVEDKVFEDIYPEVREQMLARFLTPETIAEEISKAVRNRLAAQLFPTVGEAK